MFRDLAPAKINLFLHVLGRRADGYHDLDSLVSFATIGDDVGLDPGDVLSLTIDGPFGPVIAGEGDNLIVRAARLFTEAFPGTSAGRFTLTKKLPVASGIGGGSSDAAAALRLLCSANRIDRSDSRVMACAKALGADVPVCIERVPRIMRGIGHDLEPGMAGHQQPALLINPGIAVETRAVFAELGLKPGEDFVPSPPMRSEDRQDVFKILDSTRNDLEAPAKVVTHTIALVLDALRASPGCQFARMSGSGATCFGMFSSMVDAYRAAETIQMIHDRWWIAPCEIVLPS